MRRDEMRRDVHVLAAAVTDRVVHVLAAAVANSDVPVPAGCVCLAHAQRAGVPQRGVCWP